MSSIFIRSGRLFRPFSGVRAASGVVVKSKIDLPEITGSTVASTSFPKFLMRNFLDKNLADKVAIVDGESHAERTYRQVLTRTYQTAQALRQRFGIGPGDCVAIMSPNHMDFFPAFHGISLTGAFSTTMNPLYTVGEMHHQLEVTGAKVLIVHPTCLGKAREVATTRKIKLITLADKADGADVTAFDELVKGESFDSLDLDSFAGGRSFKGGAPYDAKEELCTVPFSSGTTGKPKGVMLTHKNLSCNILQALPYEGNNLLPSDPANPDTRGVLLVPLPFFHIYGMIAGLCLPLFVGGKLVFMSAFQLQSFLENISRHKVTRAHIVPPIAIALSKHPMVDQYDLSSLRCLMSGAAPLGAVVQEQCAARIKCLVKQAWGMTEISPCGTITPDEVSNIDFIKGKSGLLVPNTEAKIVDPVTGADQPFDKEGELMIRGPQVMKGYLHNAEATRSTLRPDGWMHTGDIGFFDKDGWLHVTDRSKELIKYKGFQVPPAELEAVILSMPQVKEAIVIPVEDDEAGEIPRAYVVKQDNCPADFSGADVENFVAERVAPHKRLRGGVRFANAIPKLASGKLLRRVQVQIDKGLVPPM